MSKYKVETLYGLKELLAKNDDLYSPDGARMIVVNNGFMGGQLMYDHTNKKVYGFCLKELPTTDEDLGWLKGEYAQSQVRYNMNYADAIEYLKSKGKWDGDA